MTIIIVASVYVTGAALTAVAANSYWLAPKSAFGRHEEHSAKERRSRRICAGAAVVAWPLGGVIGPVFGLIFGMCHLYVWLCRRSQRAAI